jgi:uncharacterized protein (TIGR03067 family)
MEFQGTKLTWRVDKSPDRFMNVWLDSAPRDMVIDLFEPSEKNLLKGIFKFDGTRMTICLAEVGLERPKEYSAPKGSSRAVIEFKKN